jgi:predicted aspartyl protease
MRFSYIKLRGRYLPIVPLKVKGENGWIIYNAFVDSGAGYSIFQSDAAEDINLKIEDGKKGYVTIGDGSLIIVYIHKLEIQIANEEFEAEIGFSKQLGIGFNIIERKDIFERFKICFDEKKKVLDFYPKVGQSQVG